MTLARVPLLRIIVSLLAAGGLVIAAVLLTTAANVQYDEPVYREGDGGIFGFDSYDLTLVCAAPLSGTADVGVNDVDNATYDEGVLVYGPRSDADDFGPTTLSSLAGDLYVDRTEVLATCGQVRDQRTAVAGGLATVGLTLVGFVAAYSLGRRRRPA